MGYIMKVVLVALYDVYSYGIRGLHSVIKSPKIDVKSIFFKESVYDDELHTKEEMDDLVKCIIDEQPDFIGIGLRSPLFPLFKELSQKLRRKLKSVPILVGGHHATADPDSLIPYADVICRGESENLLDMGLWRDTIFTPPPVKDLNTLPFDYYGEDDIYCYSKEPKDTTRMSIYTTRGCFFHCSFCFEQILKDLYEGKHKVRRKSVKRTMEEIERYQEMFPKLTNIVFSDTNFTWDDEWIKEFSREFKKTGLKFRCFGHTSLANREMLDILTDAGMEMVTFGIQSASPRMLKIYSRHIDENLPWFLKSLEGLNTQMRFDFIADVPFETEEDKLMTEELIKILPKSSIVRKFYLRHFPGTPLTEYCLKEGYITDEDIEGNSNKFGHWSYSTKKDLH
jgi:anaerobic magnesium-protoporphyrin IX monomethyl ester cyclase